MKKYLLAVCGLWGLYLCRSMELDASVYIPFGIVVLTSALELSNSILGKNKEARTCGTRVRAK